MQYYCYIYCIGDEEKKNSRERKQVVCVNRINQVLMKSEDELRRKEDCGKVD